MWGMQGGLLSTATSSCEVSFELRDDTVAVVVLSRAVGKPLVMWTQLSAQA